MSKPSWRVLLDIELNVNRIVLRSKMPYLGHLFSPPATPQAKHDGRIDQSSRRKPRRRSTSCFLRVEIRNCEFKNTSLSLCAVRKKWTPEAGLERVPLYIGGKDMRLRVSCRLLHLSIDGQPCSPLGKDGRAVVCFSNTIPNPEH
jgi:hypothetical protein